MQVDAYGQNNEKLFMRCADGKLTMRPLQQRKILDAVELGL